ncbi:MAG: porin [Afipia sp.]|nr:porin [Afipia sp.]OJW61919.1 MAG: porin [Afipia sp. 64-13]
MSKIKSLILGSAAGLVAIGGAQAADLPVKAKAVEYVKVCSLYGAGFFYVPGTDTCIKLGGYMRAEFNVNGANSDAAFLNGAGGQHSLYNNANQTRARIMMQVDTRTATEYGVVRTFASFGPQWTTGDANGSGGIRVEAAFIQFAGFTFGRSASAYALPWNAGPGGNLNSILMGGPNYDAGVNNIQYTWQFGNGMSASLGVDEGSPSNRTGVYNGNDAMSVLGVYNDRYQGTTTAPDVVGNIRLDQAWGLIQLSAAAHQVTGGYFNSNGTTTGGTEVAGHPDDKWGFAITGALQIKNLPTGPGDDIKLSATYTEGALRYVLGNSGNTPQSLSLFGSGSNGAYNNIATAPIADGVYGTGVGIGAGPLQLTKAWGLNGAFNHNWNQNWSSSVFGAYSKVDYNSVASGMICAKAGYAAAGVACNPDFNISQVGFVTRWTPVKNLTFSGEVTWTNIDSGITTPLSGVVAVGGVKPAANYSFGSQDVWSGSLRVQRNF